MSGWSFNFRDEDSEPESDEQLHSANLATASRGRIDTSRDEIRYGNHTFCKILPPKTALVSDVASSKPVRQVALDDAAHQTRTEGRALQLVELFQRKADIFHTSSDCSFTPKKSLVSISSPAHKSATPDAISSPSTYSRDAKSTASYFHSSLPHSSPASSLHEAVIYPRFDAQSIASGR